MKSLLVVLLLGFTVGNLSAQNFKMFIQNSVFTSCEQDLTKIDRISLNGQGQTDKYLKNELPFTGCAKTVTTMPDGSVRENVVTEITDGYPTKATYYFPNGIISRAFNFKDGFSHGVHIIYYEDGGKYKEEHYLNGRKHGSIKRWTKEGKLGRDGFFQGGMAIYDIVYVKEDRC